MNDTGGVRHSEAVGYLRGDSSRSSRRYRALADEGAERFAGDQFRDDIRRVLVQPDIVNRHDVGMVQGGGEAGFLLEAAAAFFVASHRFRQNLQRNLPAHAAVDRPVDFAHASGAERADDLVRPNRGGSLRHGAILP